MLTTAVRSLLFICVPLIIGAGFYSIASAQQCECEICCTMRNCHVYATTGGVQDICTYSSPLSYAVDELNYTGSCGGIRTQDGVVDKYNGMDCLSYCAQFYNNIHCVGDSEGTCSAGMLSKHDEPRWVCTLPSS